MKRFLTLPMLGALTALGQTTNMPQVLFAPPQPGIVATPGEIQQLTILANAARNDAQQARDTVEGAMDTLYQLEVFSNRVAFVSGHVLSFGEDNTNIDPDATAVIIRFTLGEIIANQRHCFLWFFSKSALSGAPEVIHTARLESNLVNWASIPLLGFTIENNVEVGGTVYNPVYKLEVAVPVEDNAAFFRVVGQIFGGGPGAYFRVYEAGVQVGNDPGVTYDIIFNGVRRVTRGGIRLKTETVQ